jgi:hypothetical protein
MQWSNYLELGKLKCPPLAYIYTAFVTFVKNGRINTYPPGIYRAVKARTNKSYYKMRYSVHLLTAEDFAM